MYYKLLVTICFQIWPIFGLRIDIFAELLAILTPPMGIFWLLCTIFPSLRLYKKFVDTVVLEMYYKMFVPIGFQV
jgi:hypothetical protein